MLLPAIYLQQLQFVLIKIMILLSKVDAWYPAFSFPSGESFVSLDPRHPLTETDVYERKRHEDIGKIWVDLVGESDFNKSVIDSIKSHHLSEKERCIDLSVQWMEKEGMDGTTASKWANVLTETGLKTLAENLLGRCIQVNSAFRARWLVSSGVNSKYHSLPCSRWDKITRQEFNFWPFFSILNRKNELFFGICRVYTKTIIYFSVVNNCWRHRKTDLKYFEVNSVLSKPPFIKLFYSIKLPVKLQLHVLSAYWLKNLRSIWTCSWSFLACQLHSFYEFAHLLHENWTFLANRTEWFCRTYYHNYTIVLVHRRHMQNKGSFKYLLTLQEKVIFWSPVYCRSIKWQKKESDWGHWSHQA